MKTIKKLIVLTSFATALTPTVNMQAAEQERKNDRELTPLERMQAEQREVVEHHLAQKKAKEQLAREQFEAQEEDRKEYRGMTPLERMQLEQQEVLERHLAQQQVQRLGNEQQELALDADLEAAARQEAIMADIQFKRALSQAQQAAAQMAVVEPAAAVAEPAAAVEQVKVIKHPEVMLALAVGADNRGQEMAKWLLERDAQVKDAMSDCPICMESFKDLFAKERHVVCRTSKACTHMICEDCNLGCNQAAAHDELVCPVRCNKDDKALVFKPTKEQQAEFDGLEIDFALFKAEFEAVERDARHGLLPADGALYSITCNACTFVNEGVNKPSHCGMCETSLQDEPHFFD